MKARSSQAKRAITELKLRTWLDKQKDHLEQSIAIKDLNYLGYGLEKPPPIDPMVPVERRPKPAKNNETSTTAPTSTKPAQDLESQSLPVL